MTAKNESSLALPSSGGSFPSFFLRRGKSSVATRRGTPSRNRCACLGKRKIYPISRLPQAFDPVSTLFSLFGDIKSVGTVESFEDSAERAEDVTRVNPSRRPQRKFRWSSREKRERERESIDWVRRRSRDFDPSRLPAGSLNRDHPTLLPAGRKLAAVRSKESLLYRAKVWALRSPDSSRWWVVGRLGGRRGGQGENASTNSRKGFNSL